MAKGEGLFPW
uniref:Uncharacterized protein n=1 Tax=Rhizophora mucronata TaxID=61149 RepID=A0A2P2QNQ6_RHIMU